ncbi:MAG: CotH kinase family protein [Deltaproteobacteria bacterium]|nr:CotH kinase family protein [Deltaproteobacteria bacterium]
MQAVRTMLALVPAFVSAGPLGCGEGRDRPEGWTDRTHGEAAPADWAYAKVFPADTVNRIELTIAPADWAAMLADAAEQFGEFGAGGSVPEPTDPLAAACRGLAEGDACSTDLEGRHHSGFCIQPPDERPLTCELHVRGLVPDEMLAAACDGRTAGAACMLRLPEGPPLDGVCTLAGSLLLCDAVLPPREGAAGSRDPIWKPCTVRFDGRTWQHVGVRFKGYSSLREAWAAGSYKLPLRVEFDHFEDEHPEIENQRFYGFQTLAFANGALDDSLVREKVMGDLLRESGVPAPQSAFYRVQIDVDGTSRYFGLYTVIEVPDRPMFLRRFGAAGGNLYKPDGPPATSAASWQDGLPVNDTSFPKKSNREEADWSDVEAAIAALHADRSPGDLWREGLERRFDARGFLRWLAINTVVQNWDSYGLTCHNYYLYGDPSEDGRLHWIPWDQNLSFGTFGSPGELLPLDLATVGDDRPLVRFLMDDAEYSASYRRELRSFLEGPFAEGRIERRLREAHALVAPHIVGADGEQPRYTLLRDAGAFEASLEMLTTHVDSRRAAATAALAGP